MGANESLSRSIEQASNYKEQSFDYTALSPTTRGIVQQHANEIKSLMRRTAQDIINIGQKLLETKEQLGHGLFEAWLRSEFNWGQWTARKFMQVTRQFKSVNFTDLSIDASALYLLAAPSTPEVVRQETLERAKRGETITHAKVKVIASRYGKLTKSENSKPSFTVDIPAESVGWEASTSVEPRPAAQTVNTESAAVVEQAEDKLSGKKTEAPAHFQESDRSPDTTPAADSGDSSPKNQVEIKIQSLFKVGHLICLTDFEQQDHKCLGKVVEVKKVSATDTEVVLKISLQPSTG